MRKVKTSLAVLLSAGMLVAVALPVVAQEAEPSTITEQEALAVSQAWFEAYEDGSVADMLGLMAPDAEFAEELGPMSRDQWQHFYSWKLAEGTQLVDQECSAAANDDSTEVTVSCEYAHLPYSHRLVGAPPVPHTLTQVITADGIASQRQRIGTFGFRDVDGPWGQWLQANDPDLAGLLSFGDWSTVLEAQLHGQLSAKSAEEWAAWLDENGCTYDEPCPHPLADPVVFSGYVPFGPNLASEVTTRERGLEMSRGGSWKTRSSTTDERFNGDAVLTFDHDTYLDHGINIWAGGLRIENDEGAWQGRPGYSFDHPDRPDGSAETVVFDGEGAYEGLTALVETTTDGGGIALEGVIIESDLPELPVPRGTEPEAPADDVAADDVAEAPVEDAAAVEVVEPEPAPITELRVADVTEIGERMVDLTIESPSVGIKQVRLILPASWDEQPDATWPSLYLLHGQGGNYTNWSEDTDIAPRLAEELGLDVLMVMPDAGASYYSDWWNVGEGNAENAWATFHIEELPAILEADWRADDRRAVAGLSMGGFGAMSYAARYPGHFRAAASYSGVLDPLGSDWFHDYALWGDKEEQLEIWEAHDPVTLAANLEGTPLYVSWGDGTEEAGGPVVDGLEEWLAQHNEVFVARLAELGIPVTAVSGSGTHTWETWNPAFEESLPMLLEALEG